ncbi:hypothetical protein LAV73_23660 [Lysinibacillus xylanilyticus]|uniref:hypothetical protein n=1 Tax=Lysinibacillus xylanilyticus TaxID=582475 RepID=UPI002B240A85|nr:hypothetical protein [Lysinibacillus xylanilyticus]MEB2282919.1 hypothetical protein [Lysinibacillus xylanilyticus]
MSKTEYAKLLTSYIPGKIYGLRAVVTIPSKTWIAYNVKNRGNGFLDAYLSLDRNKNGNSYHYECGLSQIVGHASVWGELGKPGDGKWHSMYAAPNGQSDNSHPYDLAPGSDVPIELSINAKGGLDFIVNYGVKKTFTDGSLTTSDGITNARVVIGACDQDYNSVSNIPGNPLTAWGTFTNQIVMKNIAYQTARGGAWTLFDPTGKVNEVFWPVNYTHQTTPQRFNYVTSNGNLTASLKKAGINA